MTNENNLPKDGEYVSIDFENMGERINNTPAKFHHNDYVNGGKPVFEYDFCSSSYYATPSEVFEWRPRELKTEFDKLSRID